jgi:sugar phosphate isomerase/epimerase
MFRATQLHSVSYSGSWGQAFLTVDQFIDKAAELGYSGVLLMAKRPHLSVLDYNADARIRLRDRIAARGLTSVAIAGYTNFTADLEHGEVPHREFQIQHVTELARLASSLGGSLVRIFTGYEHASSTYTAQWNLIVSALKECARRAADFGVTIGVQNHHDIAVGSESMHDLLLAVAEPNCRAFYDAWSPALCGEDLVKAAHRMAPLTAHTTVADYQLRPRFRYQPALVNYTRETPYVQAVPMGDGFIDYRSFFNALFARGFNGSIAYEMCSPLPDGGSIEALDRYARRFLEYLAEFQASSAEASASETAKISA